jgi:hypothetical protein
MEALEDSVLTIDQLVSLWHLKGVPTILVKASCDPFQYALGLKNGTVFVFSEADLGPPTEFNGWFMIRDVQSHTVPRIPESPNPDLAYSIVESGISFDRGVEIHLSQVAWVADAPFGS